MDQEIAKLIEKYGSMIFPYLKIRAEYSIKGKALKNNHEEKDIQALERSGYIKVDGEELIIQENGKLLYLPKEKVKKKPKDYSNSELELIATLVGHPPDWHNILRYVKQYNEIKDKYSSETVLKVAYWVRDNITDIDLRVFLTDRNFYGYLQSMKKPTKQYEDRVEKANYEESSLEF